MLTRARGRGRDGAVDQGVTYVVMDAASVERLHSALGSAWVVEFHEAVVEAFAAKLQTHVSVHRRLFDRVS